MRNPAWRPQFLALLQNPSRAHEAPACTLGLDSLAHGSSPPLEPAWPLGPEGQCRCLGCAMLPSQCCCTCWRLTHSTTTSHTKSLEHILLLLILHRCLLLHLRHRRRRHGSIGCKILCRGRWLRRRRGLDVALFAAAAYLLVATVVGLLVQNRISIGSGDCKHTARHGPSDALHLAARGQAAHLSPGLPIHLLLPDGHRLVPAARCHSAAPVWSPGHLADPIRVR